MRDRNILPIPENPSKEGAPYDVQFTGAAGTQTLHTEVRFILENHSSFFLN